MRFSKVQLNVTSLSLEFNLICSQLLSSLNLHDSYHLCYYIFLNLKGDIARKGFEVKIIWSEKWLNYT